MVENAYDRWAPVYDLVFGGVFSKGRRAAILATNNIGGRVLEVGVGTGISLPQYASNLRIFGTDISEGMLRKARGRVAELRLKNVEGLAVMDAEKLEFPDASFDVVMAQYVVTAVPVSGSGDGRIRAGVAAGRRDHSAQPASARMPGCAVSSNNGCSPWCVSLASVPTLHGRVTPTGPRRPTGWSWSNAGRCHRSVISP